MRTRVLFVSIPGALVFLTIGVVLLLHNPPPGAHPASDPIAQNGAGASSPSAVAPATSAPPLIGERILEGYGDPARPPQEDLAGVARTLESFALLVKGDNPLPLGANEEIARALRGRNRATLRVLPDQHSALNAQGQLIDRWGTPLFFHARSRDRIDIRSAGPDREMWTADDLHRQPNGNFLRGSALLAPSLFDEAEHRR
jgi:hypothetical protein